MRRPRKTAQSFRHFRGDSSRSRRTRLEGCRSPSIKRRNWRPLFAAIMTGDSGLNVKFGRRDSDARFGNVRSEHYGASFKLEAVMEKTEHGSPLIYDFGMNKAEDTEFYLKKGFRVVGVEANPEMCERASEHFRREVVSGQLTILNRAIGESTGRFRFFVCNEMSAISTASEELMNFWSKRGETFRAIDVEFTTADRVIQEYGPPYYIKVDIEGHDIICLEQLTKVTSKPTYLSFEVDFRDYRDALNLCREMGFNEFALVDQKQINGRAAPNPPREGLPIQYTFKTGQSGTFGKELSERYVSYQKIFGKCTLVLLQYKAAGAVKRLFGLIDSKSAGERFINRLLPKTATWYDIHARVR
jgi:FkbM family methyltransferase